MAFKAYGHDARISAEYLNILEQRQLHTIDYSENRRFPVPPRRVFGEDKDDTPPPKTSPSHRSIQRSESCPVKVNSPSAPNLDSSADANTMRSARVVSFSQNVTATKTTVITAARNPTFWSTKAKMLKGVLKSPRQNDKSGNESGSNKDIGTVKEVEGETKKDANDGNELNEDAEEDCRAAKEKEKEDQTDEKEPDPLASRVTSKRMLKYLSIKANFSKEFQQTAEEMKQEESSSFNSQVHVQ